MKDYGPVFDITLLQSPMIIVCDPILARKIYEEEDEKPVLYKRGDGLTLGVSSIFSKSTHGDDHHMVRKCLAPSFSMTNIFSCLPKLHEKIDLLKKIFVQHEKDDVSFDVSEIFPRLLMDMLTTAMFDVDYHTLEEEGGGGRLLMKDLCVAVKEMMQKRMINPFRSLMFWDPEYREGLYVCMYLFMYVCMYVYIYLCIYIYSCIYIYIYFYMYTYIHMYIHIYMYTHIYIHMYIYIYT
jgi:cytochrome P450